MATIVHADMDAFFAAVEALDHPQYQGKPLIVGGPRDSVRGVVATCSYEARSYGVHSAMSIKKAVQLCPQAEFLPPRHKRYAEVSQQIFSLLDQFSPLVEPLSIDEAFLDMSGCEHFFPDLEAMGHKIKQTIREQTGITASVGIAENKFLAKLASDWKKPDGLFILPQQDVDQFLLNLPLEKLWGIGKKNRAKLAQRGITTVAQLRQPSLSWLVEHFGQLGRHLYSICRGDDSRSVTPLQVEKSISQECTFAEDISHRNQARSALAQLVAKVGFRLRQAGFCARTITLKVRYHDFRTHTHSYTTQQAVRRDEEIFEIIWQLFEKNATDAPIRLLGACAANLEKSKQLTLWYEDERQNTLTQVVDGLNTKFAKDTICRGRAFRPK